MDLLFHFDTIFLYFFGFVRTSGFSGFDNHSTQKRVSCKSKGVKFSTCSTCFVDFVSNSFFIGFCDFFEAMWGSIWHYFSEKNLSEIRLKKGSPYLKMPDYGRIQGLLEAPPLIILYKGRRLAGALSRQ